MIESGERGGAGENGGEDGHCFPRHSGDGGPASARACCLGPGCSANGGVGVDAAGEEVEARERYVLAVGSASRIRDRSRLVWVVVRWPPFGGHGGRCDLREM